MAQADYAQAYRSRVAVVAAPHLPTQPADVSPTALWVQGVVLQMRLAISKYGMASNSLALMEDQDKLRMRFPAKDY